MLGIKRSRSESELDTLDLVPEKFPRFELRQFNPSKAIEDVPEITKEGCNISEIENLKEINSKLEEQLEQETLKFKTKEECLSCEIAVLNELIERKGDETKSKFAKVTGPEKPSLLDTVLEEVTELNQRMLVFLKESKSRRIKNDVAIKHVIC